MTEFYYSQDHLLLYADYKMPQIHSHLASHLLVAKQGKLECKIGEESVSGGAVFIASDIPHTIYERSGETLVFLFDEVSACAKKVEQIWLQGRAYAAVDEVFADRLKEIWSKEKDLVKLDGMILDICGLKNKKDISMDRRVLEALDTLHTMDRITANTVKVLCDTVCLSQSRLSHLFKENTGIPLNRYLVLEKMRKGFEYFQQSGNITEAALLGGFDSSSHFAAVCKRMFGISFSEFIRSTK